MEKYIDKTGVFQDLNFKLVVIDSLLEKSPSFEEKLETYKEMYTDKYEWYSDKEPIKEILEFFAEISLTQEDLDKVTELCFDGGNEVYFIIKPDWDGEDDFFDVKSVEGFESLKNLKTVEYISMCEEGILDPIREKGIRVE